MEQSRASDTGDVRRSYEVRCENNRAAVSFTDQKTGVDGPVIETCTRFFRVKQIKNRRTQGITPEKAEAIISDLVKRRVITPTTLIKDITVSNYRGHIDIIIHQIGGKPITQLILKRHPPAEEQEKAEAQTEVRSKVAAQTGTHSRTNREARAKNIFVAFMRNIFSAKEVKEISEELIEMIDAMPKAPRTQAIRQLHSVTDDEKYIGQYLRDNCDLTDWLESGRTEADLVAEILNGAYVRIDDDGKTYDDWKQNLREKHIRLSSHASNGETQYAVRGPVVSEFLFSTRTVRQTDGSDKKVTWFQTERYAAKSYLHGHHLYTWVLYKISGKNIGPWGKSTHTENNNPIILKLKPSIRTGEMAEAA